MKFNLKATKHSFISTLLVPLMAYSSMVTPAYANKSECVRELKRSNRGSVFGDSACNSVFFSLREPKQQSYI